MTAEQFKQHMRLLNMIANMIAAGLGVYIGSLIAAAVR